MHRPLHKRYLEESCAVLEVEELLTAHFTPGIEIEEVKSFADLQMVLQSEAGVF